MYTPVEKSFELTPSGTHLAICYSFIDMGTQDGFYGRKRQVRLRWELCNELMDDGRPFSISKTLNWSMNKKSTFRHILEAWRGRPFSADELNGNQPFDTKNLLGKVCMISVIHEPGKDGEQRAKVETVTSIPKGMGGTVPKQVNPNVYFALTPDRFDVETLKSLHEKVQEAIMASPEYKRLMNGDTPDDDLPVRNGHDMDDEVPF